jgi:hypothetical protein
MSKKLEGNNIAMNHAVESRNKALVLEALVAALHPTQRSHCSRP